MTVDEIKTFFEENAEDKAVTGYLAGLKGDPKAVTDAFLKTEDGAKVLQPIKDVSFDERLKVWKEKNLDPIYQERYVKEHPPESDAEKRILALEQETANEKKARILAELRATALQTISEKKLPAELVEFAVADTEELTRGRLEKLTAIIEGIKEQAKAEILKLNGRITPADSDRTEAGLLSDAEIDDFIAKNPRWMDDPDMKAKVFKSMAAAAE